ncbi:hypothetical protein BDR06DRAFT_972768 [Suillus hirtellus]|nr:hypothetical protein BDR06DRAFT_972768 [Suillus hirtellus]
MFSMVKVATWSKHFPIYAVPSLRSLVKFSAEVLRLLSADDTDMYHCNWPGYELAFLRCIRACTGGQQGPKLYYNHAGNVFAHDNDGAWFKHGDSPGYQPASIYTLTPAFQSHEGTPPPLVSSSCLALHEVLTTNMINPMLLPLPHSDDMDLIYPASIVEATSYILATKTAVGQGYKADWRWHVCPPEVMCAHCIKELINECAGTCNVNNIDYKAVQDDDSLSVISDQYQDEPTSPPIQHTAIACSTSHAEAPAPCCNTRGAAAMDLLT